MTEIKKLKYGDRFFYADLEYIKVNDRTLSDEKFDGFCVAVNLSNGNVALFRDYVEVPTQHPLEEAGYSFEVGV